MAPIATERFALAVWYDPLSTLYSTLKYVVGPVKVCAVPPLATAAKLIAVPERALRFVVASFTLLAVPDLIM